MSKPTLLTRFRYWTDRFFAYGTLAFIIFLVFNSLITVIIYTFALQVVKGEESSIMANFAEGWSKIYTKSIAQPVDIITAISGTFIFSTLIGVLTANVNGLFARLREGRSEIIEHDHHVVLGWSAYTPILLTELVEGLQSRPRSCVVVMGELDIAEMQREMRGRLRKKHNTRIIYRRGSPIEQQDLALLHLHKSKSIIILRPPQDDPDAQVIKTLLAITTVRKQRQTPYHIVAEIYNTENVPAAKAVGRDEVEIVQVSDMVSKVIAHACRESGMSMIYNELLGFSNQELYFHTPGNTVGKRFVEATHMISNGMLIGVIDKNGTPLLTPNLQRSITANDQLIVIAENANTIQIASNTPTVPSVQLPAITIPTINQESMLILGYNKRTPTMLKHINNYADHVIDITIVTQFDNNLAQTIAQLQLKNLKCTVICADTTSIAVLQGLDIQRYNHVIVLAYTDHYSMQVADSRTLMTLIQLRQIWNEYGRTFSIVSEMMDVRNRTLAEVTEADDFVVSDRIVSMQMAQVALNKELNQIFSEWLNISGSEISLNPINMYVPLGSETTFRHVMAAAELRGHVVMGYRRGDDNNNPHKQYGIELNPHKDTPRMFKANDMLVVISK